MGPFTHKTETPTRRALDGLYPRGKLDSDSRCRKTVLRVSNAEDGGSLIHQPKVSIAQSQLA